LPRLDNSWEEILNTVKKWNLMEIFIRKNSRLDDSFEKRTIPRLDDSFEKRNIPRLDDSFEKVLNMGPDLLRFSSMEILENSLTPVVIQYWSSVSLDR